MILKYVFLLMATVFSKSFSGVNSHYYIIGNSANIFVSKWEDTQTSKMINWGTFCWFKNNFLFELDFFDSKLFWNWTISTCFSYCYFQVIEIVYHYTWPFWSTWSFVLLIKVHSHVLAIYFPFFFSLKCLR